MKKSKLRSLKTQEPPPLLRRPLPPKLPKLPLHKLKTLSVTSDETESHYVKFSQDETVFVKSKQDVFPSPKPLVIRNIFISDTLPKKISGDLTLWHTHSQGSTFWQSSQPTICSMFFPTCLSASFRVFKWRRKTPKRLRKSIKRRPKEKMPFEKIGSICLVSAKFDSSHPTLSGIAPKLKTELPPVPELEPQPEPPDHTYQLPPLVPDASAAPLSPVASSTSTVPETPWTEPVPRRLAISTVALNTAKLPEVASLPPPPLPRKPERQAKIETIAAEAVKGEAAPKRLEGKAPPAVTGSRRLLDPDAHVLRGEGFKTIAPTRYETIKMMTSLAIINCEIYGRNALNLAGFFLMQCPDLSSLALQLIYLNLSFNVLRVFPPEVYCLKNLQILKLRNNPIREIPSGIQQLRNLRCLNMAFNFVEELPHGLFNLPNLEDLDVSYNELYSIPNEIHKLRSLDRLNVDGNYLTSFPPGLLKLNLTKLQFENTFTSHYFWRENSLNSPLKLTEICASFIVRNNLHKFLEIPIKLQRLLRSTVKCGWCHGPQFGRGYGVIRSCNMFGAPQLPILFHVCSNSCYQDIRESSFILEGFPSRRISLNMDWSRERRYSDVSFYL